MKVGREQPLNKSVTKGTKKGKKHAKTQRVKENMEKLLFLDTSVYKGKVERTYFIYQNPA